MDANDMKALLDKCYEYALDGLPGMETVEELANSYLSQSGTLESKIDDMIDYQKYKCATSGFLSALGGIITMPITVPANVSSVLYVQIRMVAAVAYMSGFNIRDDKVKTFVYVALCGSSASEVMKKAGIKITEKMSEQLIKKIPIELIKSINKAVGFRLLTKAGQTGIVNLGKMVPLLGGVFGGGFDYVTTNTIGYRAKKMFYKKNLKD